MSWRDEVYRISIVRHNRGEFPFEINLYDKDGNKIYTPPFQRTCDEAWGLAMSLQGEVRKNVLDLFIIDEALEKRVQELAIENSSESS